MNRTKMECVAGAIASLGLGIIAVIFGWHLLPTMEAVKTKTGTLVPWFFTWGMIVTTALAALAVAGFLIVSGLNEKAPALKQPD